MFGVEVDRDGLAGGLVVDIEHGGDAVRLASGMGRERLGRGFQWGRDIIDVDYPGDEVIWHPQYSVGSMMTQPPSPSSFATKNRIVGSGKAVYSISWVTIAGPSLPSV